MTKTKENLFRNIAKVALYSLSIIIGSGALITKVWAHSDKSPEEIASDVAAKSDGPVKPGPVSSSCPWIKDSGRGLPVTAPAVDKEKDVQGTDKTGGNT